MRTAFVFDSTAPVTTAASTRHAECGRLDPGRLVQRHPDRHRRRLWCRFDPVQDRVSRRRHRQRREYRLRRQRPGRDDHHVRRDRQRRQRRGRQDLDGQARQRRSDCRHDLPDHGGPFNAAQWGTNCRTSANAPVAGVCGTTTDAASGTENVQYELKRTWYLFGFIPITRCWNGSAFTNSCGTYRDAADGPTTGSWLIALPYTEIDDSQLRVRTPSAGHRRSRQRDAGHAGPTRGTNRSSGARCGGAVVRLLGRRWPGGIRTRPAS